MTPSQLAPRLILIGVLLAGPAAARAADPIRWRTDYNAARKESAEKSMPLVLVIGTEECVYCRKMEATTFQDPGVAALLNARFIPVHIDGNREMTLTAALKVQAYPTTVLAGPDGKILAFLQGYVSAEQFGEHATRAVLMATTPDWVARDLDAANKALAAADYTRAVTLLKGILAETKDSPARTKAKQVLDGIERQAVDALARADGLNESGEVTAAAEALGDLMRRYAGTKAAGDAAGRLAGHADRVRARSDRARDLIAQARDDFRGGHFADCLERCEQLADKYPDLPEAAEAAQLAGQVKSDPERLSAACEQLNDRTAVTYLTLAEAWAKKGQPAEAAACLEKAARVAPNSRHAEAAQVRLAKLRSESGTRLTGFDR